MCIYFLGFLKYFIVVISSHNQKGFILFTDGNSFENKLPAQAKTTNESVL